MTVVYLRNVGAQDEECWVPCARFDAGAFEFRNDGHVWCNRQIDDLTEMCKTLLAEKKAWQGLSLTQADSE